MPEYGILGRRDEKSGSQANPALIAISALVAVIFVAIAAFVYIRSHRPPSYRTPSSTEQKSKWAFSRLTPRFRRLRPKHTTSSQDEETAYNPSTRSLTSETEMTASAENSNVNRTTSIRSVLTLPAYNPSPRADERLVAREGERAGVDVVVELPETADEEEARREEEMDALYQIRQARRREVEERNERRRERQEAREQGDWARLEQLRLDAQRRQRERSNSNVSAGSSTTTLPQTASSRELMAEHTLRAESRDRRISSVSYADLGVARHDGSRLRAESVESDHRPLLDNAANISGNDASRSRDASLDAERQRSRFHLPLFTRHRRTTSGESGVTTDSEAANRITPQTSSGEDSGGSGEQAVLTPNGSGSGGPSEPPHATPNGSEASPPSYHEPEEAPPEYSSPVRESSGGIPRLPSVRINTDLPAIEIVESTPTATRSNQDRER